MRSSVRHSSSSSTRQKLKGLYKRISQEIPVWVAMGTIIAGAFGASAYYVGKSKDVEHAVVKERELREKDKEYLEKLLMAESRAANVQAVKEIYEKFSVLASGAEYEEMRKRVKDVIAPPPPTPTSK